MKSRLKISALVLMVAVIFCVFSAGVYAKALVVGLEAEPTSLDPFNSTDGVSMTVQQTMFEGLVTFDEKGKIIPQLAEKFSFNDKVTEITFVLRKGIKFHDGSDLTADVVKANFDFVLKKDNGLARYSFFNFISGIEVKDKYTITFKSAKPDSTMASKFAHTSGSIKSLESLQRKMKDAKFNLDRNPVGTGPFQFAEWKSGEYVKVVPFKGYWGKDKAKADAIVFKPVPEASTRVNMLKTGEVHFVYPLPTMDADSLSKVSSIQVVSAPSVNVFYVGINLQHDKYKNLKVRQAMNYAVNKDQLIAQVVDGYGRIADSAIAPSVYGYAPQTVYEYNVAKAKKLMSEAGYSKGFKATLWTRNTTEFTSVAEFIALQLKEIGIDVQVQAFESGTLFDMLDAGKGTDLWIGRWGPGTGEADYGLRPNFASDRIPPNWNNSGFYINKNVDKLLNDALQSPKPEIAKANYKIAQKVIYGDAPWIFLYVPDIVAAKRAEVSGIQVHQDGSIHLNQAYVK